MVTLHHGDCLDVLKTLPDNSIDSIVTDPPYGLSFMGRKWDYDVPSIEVWQECLRVLKPGGHLLAFAGTRTQHRMAVRIEDAGFEIRDMIAWVYSTGFPKSHNFGCKCGGSAVSYTHEKTIPGEQKAERDLHTLRGSDVPEAVDTCEGGREVLQSCLQEQSTPTQGKENSPGKHERGEQSCLEGGNNILPETRELQANQVRPLPKGVFSNGEEGRVCDGTQVDNGKIFGEDSGKGGGGASCKSQSAGQQAGEPNAFPEQSGTQVIRGACEVCGKLKNWQGWGTALKPALEPITVARKPLIGTVAENVLKHGTGALNIDGCRVSMPEGEENPSIARYASTQQKGNNGWGHVNRGARFDESAADSASLGRWPANIIHDGSEEVLELFPVTGASKQGGLSGKDPGMWQGKKQHKRGGHDDNGGSAARFFYCAKASKSDRDEGCEGLEERHVATLNDYVKPSEGRTADKNGGLKRNTHPTVKPTDLMRYLCRLITPPHGVILDPFMGSGSTGKAAILEGFHFIGIEREEEYVKTAQARIERAHNQHIAKRSSLSEISDLGCRDDVYKTSLTINVL